MPTWKLGLQWFALGQWWFADTNMVANPFTFWRSIGYGFEYSTNTLISMGNTHWKISLVTVVKEYLSLIDI